MGCRRSCPYLGEEYAYLSLKLNRVAGTCGGNKMQTSSQLFFNSLQIVHPFTACPPDGRLPLPSLISCCYVVRANLQVASLYSAVCLQDDYLVHFFLYKIDHFDHLIEHTQTLSKLNKHHLYEHKEQRNQ